MRIVEVRGFKACTEFKWVDGGFDYTHIEERRVHTKGGNEFINRGPVQGGAWLYGEEVDHPASWFDLDKWTDYDAYWIGQDDITRGWQDVALLIYNERLGSAYLIKYNVSGL